MLGARATPAIAAIAAIPAIVAAMGAIVVAGVPDITANAGVTQAQIDASRVLFDKHTIREEKVYTMILLTLEQGDVISLLDFPWAFGKWTKLLINHVSITALMLTHRFQSFVFVPGKTV